MTAAGAAGAPVKRTLNLLAGDARMDDWMHAADLFEPFKRLVDADGAGRPRVQRLEVTFEPGRGTEADLEKTVNAIRESSRKGGIRAVAAWFDGGPAWRDETCRVVSTGHSWVMLDEVLRREGFPEAAPGAEARHG